MEVAEAHVAAAEVRAPIRSSDISVRPTARQPSASMDFHKQSADQSGKSTARFGDRVGKPDRSVDYC